MSTISKPEEVAIKPKENKDTEEYKPFEDESLQPKSDRHMAVKIATSVDYFNGDARHQSDEEDRLISQDNFDHHYEKPKATGLRSRKVLISIIVIAVLLVVGAIVCKFEVIFCVMDPGNVSNRSLVAVYVQTMAK